MFQIRRQGSVTVVTPEIAVNEGSVQRLRQIVEPQLADRPAFVVVDLSSVPLFDSQGLEWLLDIQDEAMKFGGEVKIASPNTLCADILALTGVDRRISVFHDTISAVGSFSR